MSYYYRQPSNRSEPRVFTVADINRQIRGLIERGFSNITVEAEVVGLTRAASGHIYFNLADPGGAAQLSAVMWRTSALRYGNRIIKGKQLRVMGRLTLYEVRGTYQMVVDQVLDAGAGAKAKELLALKKRLAAEGLFDADRKRPLPMFPRRVGIVTSRSGAAIRDIVKVVRRRFPVALVLAHAQVQGEMAPMSIVQALSRLSHHRQIDAVIVGRGGGSSEDLDAFNNEMVVRAVAEFPVPVISAVGHEIDTSLVDLAADRRAATPSEAAELAVPDQRAVEERLAQETDGLHLAIARILERAEAGLVARDRRLRMHDPRVRLKNGLAQLAHSQAFLSRWPNWYLEQKKSVLYQQQTSLTHWPKPTLQLMGTRLNMLNEKLFRWPKQALVEKQHRFSLLTANLDAISPLASLARGYAVVRRETDGAILRDARTVNSGEELAVTLHRGSLRCLVKQTILPDDEG